MFVRHTLACVFVAALASPAYADELPDNRQPSTAYMLGLIPFASHAASAYVGMTRFSSTVPERLAGQASSELAGDVALMLGTLLAPPAAHLLMPNPGLASIGNVIGGALWLGVPLTHLGYAQGWADEAAKANRAGRGGKPGIE